VPAVPTSGGPRNENGDSNSGSSDTIFHGIIPSADYLLTFIIPAVIITCMLVLAILLACLLHKKRKAGKLNLFYSESLPPRVPVILQVIFCLQSIEQASASHLPIENSFSSPLIVKILIPYSNTDNFEVVELVFERLKNLQGFEKN
jgi:hypothetical protein